MDLKFMCGEIMRGIGMVDIAITTHLQHCKDTTCRTDCKEVLPNYDQSLIGV